MADSEEGWIYAVGTLRNGPVRAEEIANLISGDHLPAETLVWKPGMTEWQTAGSTLEIASLCAPPVPVAVRSPRTAKDRQPAGITIGVQPRPNPGPADDAGDALLRAKPVLKDTSRVAHRAQVLPAPNRGQGPIIVRPAAGNLLQQLWAGDRGLAETFWGWYLFGNTVLFNVARAAISDPARGAPAPLAFLWLAWWFVGMVSSWRAAGKYRGPEKWSRGTRLLIGFQAFVWALMVLTWLSSFSRVAS